MITKRRQIHIGLWLALLLIGPTPLLRASAQDEQVLPRNGFRLYYRVIGQGRPLLMLSGGPGIDVGYLMPVAHKLAATCQCILPEQRGTGRSRLQSYTRENINLAAFVEDLEALRIARNLDRWTILGHSWGGMLAMAYAAAHPDRVDRLILADSGGMTMDCFRYLDDNIQMRLQPGDVARQQKWSDPTRYRADPQRADMEQLKAEAPGYFFDRKNAVKLTTGLFPGVLNERAHQLMIEDLVARHYDLRDKLKEFDRPVLIVQGRQDPIGDGTAYETRKTLAQASLHIIDRCGHFPWLEQPEAFYHIIEKFLE